MLVGERLIKAVQKLDLEFSVERAQVGLTYSAVQLQNGSTGVAYNFPRRGCGIKIEEGKPLRGRRAGELILKLGAENLPLSSVAMATINALINTCVQFRENDMGDTLDAIDFRNGDQVCMVGCFLPTVEKLKNRSISTTVVDQVPKPGTLPEEKSAELLPRSQVAIITATSIINGTIDRLLGLADRCREVVLLGPSTPMLTEVFRGTPVNLLSGIRVDQPDKVFQVIAEGMGFNIFKRYVAKVNLRISE
jgi:uncharacterized protein (DUF4213/DUF364 family)